MKITDVTVTLFAWDDIPATAYGRMTGQFGGKSQLGLVTISTDEGIGRPRLPRQRHERRAQRRRRRDRTPQADADGP